MKILGVAVLGVVVLIVILGLVLVVYAKSEATTCYGIFDSGDAAGRAADAARDVGFDAEHEYRGSRSAVTFVTGETGDDAREARQTFRAIVKREGGRLGHPGNGCLERGPFEH
ncbi:MAG TPA: hypothetical protein VGR11_14365 [Solirubrobacteraceae bacterium]|nr:hypothetical protein [Solirubrobacteraceae bacterium]